MTTEDARRIQFQFHDNDEKEPDGYIEAMRFLIEEENDPKDMLELGGYYYGQERFDLALKYYEMSATFNYIPAFICLGYIWYYGRVGDPDFKSAYACFKKAMDAGSYVATYKIADMYHNGYYVEKDEKKYEELIEPLYFKVRSSRLLEDPVPEVCIRYAKIRSGRGEIRVAINIYLFAKDFLAQRMEQNSFFGNYAIMRDLIDNLYSIYMFDWDNFDLYDLYYVFRSPHNVSFKFHGEIYEIHTEWDGYAVAILFNGKWFQDIDAFFEGAEIEGERLTKFYSELTDFTVLK